MNIWQICNKFNKNKTKYNQQSAINPLIPNNFK